MPLQIPIIIIIIIIIIKLLVKKQRQQRIYPWHVISTWQTGMTFES